MDTKNAAVHIHNNFLYHLTNCHETWADQYYFSSSICLICSKFIAARRELINNIYILFPVLKNQELTQANQKYFL